MESVKWIKELKMKNLKILKKPSQPKCKFKHKTWYANDAEKVAAD